MVHVFALFLKFIVGEAYQKKLGIPFHLNKPLYSHQWWATGKQEKILKKQEVVSSRVLIGKELMRSSKFVKMHRT